MDSRATVGALAAAGLGLLSCVVGYGLLHGLGPRPLAVDGPPDPLPTVTPGLVTNAAGSVCEGGVDGWDKQSVPALFWVGVDRGPELVVAVWWPTLNDRDCRVVSTRGDRAAAGVLAAGIRAASAIPSGTFNCPAAFGGAVDLYFSYAGGRWERVRVHPTGCGRITGPGRKPRQALLGAGLAAIAPPGEWSRPPR